jgi:hypothetical protein
VPRSGDQIEQRVGMLGGHPRRVDADLPVAGLGLVPLAVAGNSSPRTERAGCHVLNAVSGGCVLRSGSVDDLSRRLTGVEPEHRRHAEQVPEPDPHAVRHPRDEAEADRLSGRVHDARQTASI